MSDTIALELHREGLRRAIEKERNRRPVTALAVSPWVAMSAMQKAIRRGHFRLARRAAATLLEKAPGRLWRCLGRIAAEDVGLGSLKALGIATAALAGKTERLELGGDWPVACAVIHVLAAAPKCRAAGDLLMMSLLHHRLDAFWDQMAGRDALQLASIVTGDGAVEQRATALLAALTKGTRSTGRARARRDANPVFEAFGDAGWAPDLVELARRNFNSTGVILAPLVALLARELPREACIAPDEMTPEIEVKGVPSWCLDVDSPEGVDALKRFLIRRSATSEWLHLRLQPSWHVPVLGHFLFRVEGSLVNRRLRWPKSDEFRQTVDVGCIRMGADASAELLETVRSDLRALNEVRARRLLRLL